MATIVLTPLTNYPESEQYIASAGTSNNTSIIQSNLNTLAARCLGDSDITTLATLEGVHTGSVVLISGSATVSYTGVTADSLIFLDSQVGGGTPGWLRISARTAGTSFTITSSSGTDTSTVAYMVIEPVA